MQLAQPAAQNVVSASSPAQNNFIFRLIWLIFILAVFFDGVINYFLGTKEEGLILAVIGSLGLIALLVFKYILKSDQKAEIQSAEILTYTLFVLASIFFSGGFNSPFIFGLLLPVLTTPNERGPTSPFVLSFIELLLYPVLFVSNPLSAEIFVKQPLNFIVTIITPIIVGGIVTILKKPIQIQQIQIEKEDKDIQNLSTQLELLQSILQSIQEGMLITDLNGKVSFANKKAAEIFQVDVNVLHNQDLVQLLGNDAQALSQTLSNAKMEIVNPLGKKLTLKISSFPLISGAKMNGQIFLLYDQTGESELEKMKLDFVAQAAHQLRTPLTILKSYLSVLGSTIKPKLTEHEAVYLERSLVGANQLSMLIENLLSVSKIEDNKLVITPKPSSLEQLINSAMLKNINNANQRGIKIYFTPPADLPTLNLDPDLIEQAIDNLLANAVENSHQGGDVTISIQKNQGFLVVSVTDKGEGIASEATAKLFNKFYKVSSNLIQATKGMGVGLFNTKAIIEAHGGTISVNSIVGRGSTFYFTLPIR